MRAIVSDSPDRGKIGVHGVHRITLESEPKRDGSADAMKEAMHLNMMHITLEQILWALVLAAHLVLLVVLLGRDRTRRFSWFTALTMLSTVRLLADHLLEGKLSTYGFYWQSYALLIAASIFLFGVLIELSRLTFGRGCTTGKPLSPLAWQGWTFLLLAVAFTALILWGPWPDMKAMQANRQAYPLLITVVVALKSELFTSMLAILTGLMMMLFGGRFGSGFRSHAVQIVIGLSTVAVARLTVEGITDTIKVTHKITNRADYQHILQLYTRLDNARLVIWLLAILWWIYALWRDEPGATAQASATLATDGPVPVGAQPDASVEPTE